MRTRTFPRVAVLALLATVAAATATLPTTAAEATSWQAQYESLRGQRDQLLTELEKVDGRVDAVTTLFGQSVGEQAAEALATQRQDVADELDVHNDEILALLAEGPAGAVTAAPFPTEVDYSSPTGFELADGTVTGAGDTVVEGGTVSVETESVDRGTGPAAGIGSGSAVLPSDFPYAPYFNQYGSLYGVDPRLLAAFAMVESSFSPSTVNCEDASSAGALGLMQFMPGTAASYGIDPCIPEQAIEGAARYISRYYEVFGDWLKVMVAYNAGPGRVDDYERGGPAALSEETRNYLIRVPQWWQRYQELYPGPVLGTAAVCPLPGSSFSNDWGDPRSGGRVHQGTDMFSTYGAPILSPADGVVRLVDPVDEHILGSEIDRGGIAIGIWSVSGDAWYFGHLDSVADLQVGDPIVKGQMLGRMGQSGNARSSVAHLHIEYRPGGGDTVNPYPFLVQMCGGG